MCYSMLIDISNSSYSIVCLVLEDKMNGTFYVHALYLKFCPHPCTFRMIRRDVKKLCSFQNLNPSVTHMLILPDYSGLCAICGNNNYT